MTSGIDVSGSGSRAKSPGPRVSLPASRAGLAWLGVLLLVGAFVVFQVGRQVYASWSIGQEQSRIEADIAAIEAENQALRRELTYLHSDAYITQEARRLLNIGRYGDQILMIPPGAEVEAPQLDGAEVAPPPPLLEQWLELFFGP